jgi:hypothetical protein
MPAGVRYTDALMVRRLMALAVAMVFFGAPLAAEFCRITCAAVHAGHSGGAHHHSRSTAVPQTSQAIDAVPHSCGHRDFGEVGLDQNRLPLLAVAIVSTSVFADLPLSPVRPLDATPHASPPSFLRLSSQLRV